MKSLEFLLKWQARPFVPFRLTLKDGRTLDIPQPQQAAISPGLRQVAIFTLDEPPVVFAADDIAAITLYGAPAGGGLEQEVAAGAAAAALASAALLQKQILDSQPRPSSGRLSLMSFSTTDRRRLVSFAMTTNDGKPLVSSAGTR